MTDLVRGFVIPQIVKSVRDRIRSSICNTLRKSASLLLLETSIFYVIIVSLQYFDRPYDTAIYIHGTIRTLYVTVTFFKLGWKINRFKAKYAYIRTFRWRLDIYTCLFFYVGILQLLLWFWYNIGLVMSVASLSLLFFLYKEAKCAYSLQHWILNQEIVFWSAVYLLVYAFSIILIQ